MHISVIIPTYNRARTLQGTLESLIQQSAPGTPCEIIVVDNNSSDRTAGVVREAQARSPIPIIYHLETKPGVHYARNWGALNARGTFLYYTDDDMVVDRNALSELLRLFEFDSSIGTASGQVLPQWECNPPPWVKKYCENGLLSLQLRPEELIVSSSDVGIYSCHQAIRKTALLECGGFNPENTAGVWVGDGETGLNLKLRARGYRFAYTSKAVTHHLIPPERMTQQYLNCRFANQGYADAFTWFRAERPDNQQLVRGQTRCMLGFARESLALAARLAMARGSWRLRCAQVSYFYARFKYIERLKKDARWREFVLRDNWIDDGVANSQVKRSSSAGPLINRKVLQT